MTPSQQQTIINGVVVENYEWVIYYNKLVKASKQQPEMAQEQPATRAELLAQIAESQAVTKRLLDKYKTDHWLAPSLSVDAEVFTPEPEPEPEPEVVFESVVEPVVEPVTISEVDSLRAEFKAQTGKDAPEITDIEALRGLVSIVSGAF